MNIFFYVSFYCDLSLYFVLTEGWRVVSYLPRLFNITLFILHFITMLIFTILHCFPYPIICIIHSDGTSPFRSHGNVQVFFIFDQLFVVCRFNSKADDNRIFLYVLFVFSQTKKSRVTTEYKLNYLTPIHFYMPIEG